MSPLIKKTAGRKVAAKKPARKKTGLKKPSVKKVVKPAVKKAAKTSAKPRPAAKAPSRPKTAPRTTGAGKAVSPIDTLRGRQALAGVGRGRPGLEGKTNQDLINVIYKAAEELGTPAWTLLAKAKLEHLINARTAPYTGPAVADMHELSGQEKAMVQKVLDSYVRPKK